LRVVFLDDVDGVARAGEIKNVADGYARNFLLPRKLAAAATTTTMQQAEKRARALAKEQEKIDEAAQMLAGKLTGSPIVIEAKVGEQGRLFGSVTATDIAEAVSAHAGSKLEHRQVALGTPIKEVGTYEVAVSLSRNVKAQLTVLVKGEGEDEAPNAASTAKSAEADDGEDDEDAEEEDDE
jgi:large subunit ribosomal protein L9